MSEFWKEDWRQGQANLTKWWKREGPALCVIGPKAKPWAVLPEPICGDDLQTRWCDPSYRFRQAEWSMSRLYFGGEAFPYFDTQIGPGSLGTFFGAEPEFAPDTVWYRPCIDDPDAFGDIRFDPENYWFRVHLDLIEWGVRHARGRFLVGMPDLIENLDTLAQMRDPQRLMIDLVERPKWVKKCVSQINRAYFDAFERIYRRIEGDEGGNAFSAFRIWGPGKTAKLQCDASAMFSTAMFEEFAAPALAEQCRWLDYSLYHLDGTQAIKHLDSLLKIDALDGIEWTPQAGIEGGGHARWHPMYKKIVEAGKCIQAIGVDPHEVRPLLDACGSAGVFIMSWVDREEEARRLVDLVDKYR
ncbi:MAG: hypothetical protein IT426_19295 [Pirellulales bacterium]|nr:hypothetical protein [Pirellulales bacterium]